jgi:hypothetical protein
MARNVTEEWRNVKRATTKQWRWINGKGDIAETTDLAVMTEGVVPAVATADGGSIALTTISSHKSPVLTNYLTYHKLALKWRIRPWETWHACVD